MAKDGFKGNKSYLPTKDCIVCKRPFAWRKNWEKNWNEIKYCSNACRAKAKRNKATSQ